MIYSSQKSSLPATKVQIIFCGVGGQGILFASRLFSELGIKLGLNVIGSETHGMSQRGGSVTAHLKLGDFQSPMIRSAAADILYSFEENETYKNLKFLRRGGVCFVDLRSQDQFDKNIFNYLQEKEIILKTYDASGVAQKISSTKSANIVLIGYSIGTGLVPFKEKDLKSVLELVSRKADLKKALEAFEIGFKEGSNLHSNKKRKEGK